MKIFQRLISSYRKFPGIGPKQAERLALYSLRASETEINELIDAIKEVREKINLCKICFNYSEKEICEICSNSNRNKNIICVVENAQDLEAIEKTSFYNGLYHVLGGVISPQEGFNINNLKILELEKRVKENKIEEVIIATNPSAEGQATAIYIKNLIKPYVNKISRIALGVPLGGDINYMDELTLTHAIEGRRKI